MTVVEVMAVGPYTRIEVILEKMRKRIQADNEVNLPKSFPDIRRANDNST
jgi:hypothetical protein